MGVSIGAFVRNEIGTVGDDEPFRVDKPAELARVGFGHAFIHQAGDNHIGNADASFACPQEEKALIGQVTLAEAQGRIDASHRHAASALNVIIKEAGTVTVLI